MTRAAQTGNGVIRAQIAGVAIYGLAMGVTYPLLGIELAERVSGLMNGFNIAATGIGLLLGVMVVPPAARRFGAGRVALAGVVVMALSLVWLALVRDFWALFAARLMLGCGANLLFVVAEATLNTFAPPARRGRVMGFYAASVAFGFVVGPSVVAAMPGASALLLVGCAAVTVLALLPMARIRGVVDHAIRPTAVGRILPAIAAHPFAFGFMVVGAAVDAVAISLLPVIAEKQAFSLETGAIFVTVFHAGLLCGQPLIGAALDLYGRRRVILGCCLVSGACTVALAYGGSVGAVPTGALMFVWGAANFGLYTASLALIGDRFRAEMLTAASAAFAAVYAVASTLAPVMVGGMLDGVGAEGFYAVAAGIYLISLLAGAALFRPMEPTLVRR